MCIRDSILSSSCNWSAARSKYSLTASLGFTEACAFFVAGEFIFFSLDARKRKLGRRHKGRKVVTGGCGLNNVQNTYNVLIVICGVA